MKRTCRQVLGLLLAALAAPGVLLTAADTVATTVYAKVARGYKRVPAGDGGFMPEYYALSNGGRIAGSTSDNTIDRVTYPEVAEIAARFLAQQNYRYARSKEQAQLLLVLNWGATISYNGTNYGVAVQQLGKALALDAEKKMYAQDGDADSSLDDVDKFTEQLLMVRMENKVRDDINLPNAKILGYLDAINDADGIQRWAGGGDRYNDLLADIEEPRYYIVISAYDFPELLRSGRKQLLWQTRVSVRSPGNSFDDSFVPMLKSASAYFGRDSGKLVRNEEAKAAVDMGELKFMGVVKQQTENPPETQTTK